MKRLKNIAEFIFNNVFEKFFAAWFLSSAAVLLVQDGNTGIDNVNLFTFMFSFFAFFILICSVYSYSPKHSRIVLVLSVFLFSVLFLLKENSIYTFIALAIFFSLAVHYYFSKKENLSLNLNKKVSAVFIILVFAFFFAVVTAISVLRYLNYGAPNYDFGIFVNMFYNMKESFTPVTTCERDTLLSHFAVHFSPAVYVFLPLYWLFPSPITVAVCQTLAIYSGLIPFVLILKHRKIEPVVTCLLSVVFMANTAFSMGCSYDFHENCLLVPFLMWMIYFYEKKKTVPFFIFAVFTLMVKEDAFIYVAVFAAFIIVSDKEWKKGVPLGVLAVGYFLFACWYINNYGLGIMEGRFDVMISGDDGLFGIVKTVFANLSYTVTQIFTTSEDTPEKLIYFIKMLCPLAFIPFFTKKPARLILVLPILLNLLTDYGYQYDISFQYGFGITSLMMYAVVLNLSDYDEKKRSFASALAAGLAVMMFFMCVMPTCLDNISRRRVDREMYDEIDAVLAEIDEDAKLCVSTFLLPHVAQREEIYEVHYTQHTDFDYVILDYRPGYKTGSMKFAEKYESYGYVQTDSGSEYVAIYVKNK